MARTIGNEVYLIRIRPSFRPLFIEKVTYSCHQFQISDLAMTPNDIGFTKCAMFQNQQVGTDVISNVKPVAYLFTISIERDLAPSEC